ncbi:hypothetical protein [Rhodovarius lipocyclicus]|uniref:hypothetical protein n=1 Tax=Rhodovarius lipocyclicus TaxID=268410 RepID=UPI00135B12AC|nr:hypothetical protein [Rhodovarius lipocyclicus]
MEKEAGNPTPPCPLYTIEGIAARLARLSPSHRDPEQFHIDKSELLAELRRLARTIRRGR